MKWLIAFAASLTLLLGGAGVAAAQTISQPDSYAQFNVGGGGQSFTATVTGNVTQIAVRPDISFVNDTLTIYYGPNGSGVIGAEGVAAYTQSVTTVAASTHTSPLQTFVLTTPFPVVAGNTYSFVFANTRLHLSLANPYLGGTAIYEYANLEPTYDLAFEVTQVVPPASVPTLSEWAMILFAVAMAGFAALLVQKRRRA